MSLSSLFCALRHLRAPLALALLPVAPLAEAQATLDAGVLLEPHRSTASADIARDGRDALHAAYVHWEPDSAGAAAVYATCSGPAEACADPAAWTSVTLAAATQDVQVAVTADGRPRLLITAASQTQGGGRDHLYAECDAACQEAASWTVTPLATSWDNSMSAILSGRSPKRSFLLDPWGRPQFLYSDRNYLVEPDHYGTLWMTCKAGCANPANWTETDIARHSSFDTEIFDDPALAVDALGRPRVVARVFALGETEGEEAPEGLYYLACDAGCTDPAGWRRTWVIDAGGGSYPSPGWDIAIDPQGRPRIAFFAGDGMTEADLSHTLIYGWCDAPDCTASEEVWSGTMVATEGHGEMPALALDLQGRPRLAFRSAGGELAWASCEEACETPEGAWEVARLAGQAELSAARPTALPFTCDGEVWEGIAPQIALAPDGMPLVAYDVSVEGRCLYQEAGEPEITYEFHPLWRGARVVAVEP